MTSVSIVSSRSSCTNYYIGITKPCCAHAFFFNLLKKDTLFNLTIEAAHQFTLCYVQLVCQYIRVNLVGMGCMHCTPPTTTLTWHVPNLKICCSCYIRSPTHNPYNLFSNSLNSHIHLRVIALLGYYAQWSKRHCKITSHAWKIATKATID